MATAQELFALTTGEEQHIVIGSDRYITVPEPLKRIAVQFDHDVETVTFDCPRYWDDLDMSKMIIYINYKLPDGTLDAYPAKNIIAEDDIMHFDWTISRNLTQYKGTITFLVCIKKTAEGVETNHWNSELCTDMYVSEGMECEEQTQMEYSDLITQLLERMTVVENINIQADAMQALVDEAQTLYDETTAVAELAQDESNYIKNSYANAYKQSVSGEVIRVDDVSPLEHTVDVKVSSTKNIINLREFQLGKSFLGAGEGNDIYTADSARSTTNTYVPIEPNTMYTFSLDNTVYWLDRMCEMDENDICVKNHAFYTGLYPNADSGGDLSEFTWTTNSKTKYLVVRLVNKNGDAVTFEDLQAINLQIEKGDTVTDYVCYDPTAVTLMTCGKNFWHSRDLSYPRTVSGVTINYDPDTQIYTFTGTSTSPGDIYVVPNGADIMRINAGETWTLKVEVIGGKIDGAKTSSGKMSPLVNTSTYTNTIHANAESLYATKKYTESANITKMYFYVYAAGINFESFKCRIQFEMNDKPTEFEKSPGITKYTPNTDGTVEKLCSIYPTTILRTDTPGITINAEYNKDMQKVVSGTNTDMYMFSMQQLTDMHNKYNITYLPITVLSTTFNGSPALKIIYRLYTGMISNGILTKLFDMPIDYNLNPDLYELIISNLSDFKCGYANIADTWININDIVADAIYDGTSQQIIEGIGCIRADNIYGIGYSQIVSFDLSQARDAMVNTINTLIPMITHIGWEYKPTKHTMITPKYLG